MRSEDIHIFLDLDGVLANFVGGVEEEFDADLSNLDHWGIWKSLDISSHDFWNKLRDNPRFWFDLEPYPWARDLVNLCLEKSKGNTTIVTSPDMTAHTYGQKAAWIMKFYPGLARKFFVGPEKHLLAQPDRILIDDADSNIEKFHKAGGRTITFPQKWNKAGFNFFEEKSPNPIGYIRDQLDSKIAIIEQ